MSLIENLSTQEMVALACGGAGFLLFVVVIIVIVIRFKKKQQQKKLKNKGKNSIFVMIVNSRENGYFGSKLKHTRHVQ